MTIEHDEFVTDPQRLCAEVENYAAPLVIVRDNAIHRLGLLSAHSSLFGSEDSAAMNGASPRFDILAIIPGVPPEWLGSRSFRERHRLRYAYLGGAMARGISSVELVSALAQLGAMGFFGSAGLPVSAVEDAVVALSKRCGSCGWGVNLIHSHHDPALEDALVDTYLRHHVERVCAAAFMQLSPALVRYSATGLTVDPSGVIRRKHHLFAKVSRVEVARPFLSPPPVELLEQLVHAGQLSTQEATLASRIPVATAITAEGDSGGHTDNRPLGPLWSSLDDLRSEVARTCPEAATTHLGAAGGLGTPEALASAFELGADYVMLGSVHQCTTEAGTSPRAKALLSQVDLADVAMTASADMFELGVKVQVATKGTQMALRGNELYGLYQRYESLEQIPEATLTRLARDVFRKPIDEVWEETRVYHQAHNPKLLTQAQAQPKVKMALVFRWYLAQTSRWPLSGHDRERDYQLWCGPALGAFNRRVRGTVLEAPENRSVAQVATFLLEGAARQRRVRLAQQLGLL